MSEMRRLVESATKNMPLHPIVIYDLGLKFVTRMFKKVFRAL